MTEDGRRTKGSEGTKGGRLRETRASTDSTGERIVVRRDCKLAITGV
jgi:hypothetical protein